MKKFMLAALACCFVFAGCEKTKGPEPVIEKPAVVIVKNGTTGPLEWQLADDGTLTIGGTGAMPDYTWERDEALSADVSTAPWGRLEFSAVVIEDGVRNVGKFAFYKPRRSPVSVVLPDGITKIDEYAFYLCYDLAAVTIPESVTTIGDFAFGRCESLMAVEIPESVTTIGYAAFYECFDLTSITIPDSVTSLGQFVFGYCEDLQTATIGDGVPAMGDHLFYFCTSLRSVSIGIGVASIGKSVFENCIQLDRVAIPTAVKSIGEAVFWGCASLTVIDVDAQNTNYSAEGGVLFDKAKSRLIQYPASRPGAYVVPATVETIEQCAFESNKLLSGITFPDGLEYIGQLAFYSCTNLTALDIPDSVTGIGQSAFIGCTSLASAKIGSGLTMIQNTVFHDCPALKDVTVMAAAVPTLVQDMEHLNFEAGGDTLHVPAALKDAYEADPTWNDAFTNIVALE